MKYNPIKRRHFLQGTCGSALALPLLTSLLTSEEAQAQAAPTDQRFFILISSGHGGLGRGKDWFPSAFIDNQTASIFNTQNILTSVQNNIPHTIRSAQLEALLTADPAHAAGNVDNGNARISYILGSFLNPYVKKINLLAGIDGGMNYYGHSAGVTGGNIYDRDDDVTRRGPTLEHVLAQKIYPDLNAIANPVFCLSENSWTMAATQYASITDRIDRIYANLFAKYVATTDPVELARLARREFLIDRTLLDYQRLISPGSSLGRRISSVDKLRVENHLELIYQVESKYKKISNSCSDVNGPKTTYEIDHSAQTMDGLAQGMDMLTDLLTAAINCGSTRLANVSAHIGRYLYSGDYHQNIAHAASSSTSAQLTHNTHFRWQAQNLVAALAKKLDALPSLSTGTLLDKGVILWAHECNAFVTHGHTNIGTVMIGSLDGFFKTNNFVDYRNLQNNGLFKNYGELGPYSARPGIPNHRLLANIAQGFGLVPADYQRNGRPGFGDSSVVPVGSTHRNNPTGHQPYTTEMLNSFNDKMPIITS